MPVDYGVLVDSQLPSFTEQLTPRESCPATRRQLLKISDAVSQVPRGAPLPMALTGRGEARRRHVDCGNTVNVIGLLDPAFGNSCSNGSGN
ncbi:chaplin [Streptomyces sp. NPDC005356]|uniref:chaplin n=1 Tax=unclassified Streptomyces TaxID=2593676 RepID=UPI0033BCDBA0